MVNLASQALQALTYAKKLVPAFQAILTDLDLVRDLMTALANDLPI
jgi:hypothetical protein